MITEDTLNQYRSNSERLAKVATDKTSVAQILPDKIKSIIDEKLANNRDIIEQQRNAQADYFNAGNLARQKYEGIINPLQKESLVNQYRTQQYAPYAALSDVRAKREGTIGDIIGQASRAGSAEAMAAQGAAQIARQAYQDILAEYQFNEREARAKDEFNKRMAIENARLALSRAAAARSSAPKVKELSLGDIATLKQMGVEIPEGASYDDARRYLENADLPQPIQKEEPLTQQDYTEYSPVLGEQLSVAKANGTLPPLNDVIKNLNAMGYDPYDEKLGRPMQDVLSEYYGQEDEGDSKWFDRAVNSYIDWSKGVREKEKNWLNNIFH